VTITHPGHPLHGQRVEVVQLGPGLDPDLIVKRADGRHFPIALSSTDSVPSNENESTPTPEHLLELQGLRQVVQVLAWMDQIPRSGQEL
jgi:hypothetical protein